MKPNAATPIRATEPQSNFFLSMCNELNTTIHNANIKLEIQQNQKIKCTMCVYNRSCTNV